MSRPRSLWLFALGFAPLAMRIGVAHAGATNIREHPPAPHAAVAFTAPKVQEARLHDGTRVLVVERHDLPVVSLRLISDIGALHAPSAVARIAARVAQRGGVSSTLLEGPLERPASADVSTHADFDRTEIDVKALANEVESALAYAAGLATHPSWQQENLDREVAARSEAIRSHTVDLEGLAYAATYPLSHPLHGGLDGDLAAVNRVKLDALRAYWSEAFSRGHLTVVVVGDVRTAPLLAALESGLDGLPSAQVAAAAVPVTLASRRREIVVVPSGGAQSTVVVACTAPTRDSPEYFPTRLFDAMLGGGTTSRLFGIRSEHGVTYGVFSSLTTRRDGGTLMIHGAVERAHTAESVTRILAELQRLASTPIEADELARAKAQLTHQIPAAWTTVNGLSASIAALAARGLPMSELATYDARIRAVTAQQVMDVAKKYADPSNVSVTIVGSPGYVGPQLDAARLGPWRTAP